MQGLYQQTFNVYRLLIHSIFFQLLNVMVIHPLLTKPSLKKNDVVIYHPFCHMPFLGKVIERAVADRLHVFLDKSLAMWPWYL